MRDNRVDDAMRRLSDALGNPVLEFDPRIDTAQSALLIKAAETIAQERQKLSEPPPTADPRPFYTKGSREDFLRGTDFASDKEDQLSWFGMGNVPRALRKLADLVEAGKAMPQHAHMECSVDVQEFPMTTLSFTYYEWIGQAK
jgi:hypothetical protein